MTRRHRSARQPRAHWLLLLLAMVVLLAELLFTGWAHNGGAEGSGPHPIGSAGAPARLERPIVRIAADGTVSTTGMPARTLALTFDDGPDPRWTPQILDVLARFHAHATFFVIGSQAVEYPDLVRRMVAEGHEVAAHTYTHTDLTTAPPWRRQLELALTTNALAAITGRVPTLCRPPYASVPGDAGTADLAAMRDIAAAGQLTVLADRDTEDWRRPGVNAIVKAGLPTDYRGAIVMMHDGGGNRSQTVAALSELLTTLRARGYEFTTVSKGAALTDSVVPAGGTERLRGNVLRAAQKIGDGVSSAMAVLLVVGLGLAVIRLLVQVVLARVHARRARRQRPRRRYLGPVSVIVPAFNEAANIAATVRSLFDSDYPELEIIVVDDGSTDGTAEVVRRMRLPGVHILRQPNAGKPAALNTGIRFAAHNLLILVDGDTIFEPDAIGHLIQPFAAEDVGAISGNTKVANRRRLLGRWQHLEYVVGFNLDRRMFDLARCMPTVPGAIGAFRRAAIIDAGGVSGQTLAEDTDLTMAVVRAGWRVVYVERAIAWTEAPSNLRQLWRQRYRWSFGTMQSMWKHRSSFWESGASGVLGRRGLAYLLLFQILLPLTAPAIDVYALYALLVLPWSQVALIWCGFLVLQAAAAAYALRLDGERLGTLWVLPLQQLVYRQLMYLVVVQSTVTALIGSRLRWHRMQRTGEAQAMLARR